MFPPSFLDDVTARTDIVELINGYTTLRHRGGSWVGLCPFHNEKTPSFHVTPEKQVYYCFGCGAGGGIVQFTQAAENLSFQEAVEFLASRAGVAVPEQENDGRYQLIKRLLDVNRDAARWFYEQLALPENRRAVDYLQRRRLSPAIVTKFGVGFAPDSWDKLLNAMTDKGYSKTDLLQAGLLVKNQKGGYYDKFRDRIMFPILDVRKRVIAFGGRALDDGTPKYLNSPETPLFSKSRELYALHEAKATKSGRLVVTEGYLDTLALYQAGFDCAVASLGTSLTVQHAAVIARYAKEAVLAYDSDDAGKTAAARAAPILQKAGLNVRVLSMRGAKDPDEFINTHGRDAFAKLLDGAQTHADHTLAGLAAKHDTDTDSGRIAFLKEAVELIASMPNPIEREVYTGRAAQTAGVSVETAAAEIRRILKQKLRKDTRAVLRNPGGKTGVHGVKAKLQAAEENLLRILLTDPSLWRTLPPELTADRLTDPFVRDIFTKLQAVDGAGGLAALDLTGEASGRLTRLMQKPSSNASDVAALRDCLSIIQSHSDFNAASGDDKLAAMMEYYKKNKGQGGDSNE